MHRTIVLFGLLILWGLVGCGRGARDSATPQEHTEAEPSADLRTVSGPAAALIGKWELASKPPQRMPGLHITVSIDSVIGARYFGRLTNYFSGNVGQDPEVFEAFSDSIRTDGGVTFSLPTVGTDMLGMKMEGRLTVDTIDLDLFVLGPDTISSGARRWILVR